MKVKEIEYGTLDFENFVKFPLKIYGDNFPLMFHQCAELNPEFDFFNFGRAKMFLCEKNGTVLGRIVASYYKKNPWGQIGYFEAIENEECMSALLDSALNWARQEGLKKVHGPINLNIYNGYRFMTEGFHLDGFLGEPRNPQYYPEFFKYYGFKKEDQWRSFDLDVSQMEKLHHVLLGLLNKRDQKFSIKTFTGNQEEGALEILYKVIMEVFKDNYGFEKISFSEFCHYYGPLSFLFKDQTMFSALDNEGNIAGLGLSYLDYMNSIKLGKFPPKASTIIVGNTIGVLPKYRKSLAAYVLVEHFCTLIEEKKCTQVIGALVKEGKSFFDRVGRPTRFYETYLINL